MDLGSTHNSENGGDVIIHTEADIMTSYFQVLQARFEGSQFCYKSSGSPGCQFLQKFVEKLVKVQDRQKDVLEGVTAIMKITDYKTQVSSVGRISVHLEIFQDLLLTLVLVFDVSMTPGIAGATPFQIKELSLKTEYS